MDSLKPRSQSFAKLAQKWNSIELYLGFHLFGRIKEVLSVRFTNFGLHNNETEGLKVIGQDDGCDGEGVG
ncbi:unnamed protein product [Prunus armeniaca]|uniref:Uncharacterized protein n=1 Tax=Prunus armeniaca TaxID=36596 RepID=A0A6J5XEB7_PRUAR|nr:unnamed protein product [Prunus armeniaca]